VTDNSQESNQRTIRAVIVCLLVVFVYTNLFLAPKKKAQAPVAPVPQQAQQNAQAARSAEVAPTVIAAKPSGPVQVVGAQQPAHPSAADVQAAGITYVQSGLLKVGFSHLGARVQSYSLSNYKKQQGDEAPLDLVGDLHDAALPLGIYRGNENDERVTYTLASVNGAPASSSPANLQIAPGGKVSLEFKGALPSGVPITKTVTLSDNSYLFTVDVAIGSSSAGQNVWLEWLHTYPEEQSRNANLSHTTYLDGANKIHHLSADELKSQVRATTKWVALGDLYFMASLIPALAENNAALARTGDLYIGRVAGTDNGGSFTIFAGPKVYKMLEELGSYQLERSIDLGIFSFLALPLLWLLQYLYLIVHNYGLAIIALTLIIKTALLPLSQASFKSMKAMQEIQPEMKALRERIKDPNQLNQEVMALYKRRGVNPMGGCLPIVIQIPVFFGLYQALLNAIELRHASFALWITDLSAPEKLEIFGWGVPVMVLLMAASMILQQWTTPNPSADPTQQKVMMFMPIMFAGMFIVFPMPAGLVLYWLVNNIISITQQMYLRKANQSGVYWGTFVASVAIFGFGYILTLI
jgi:YidC/Oxa1 family membrane protein insertase